MSFFQPEAATNLPGDQRYFFSPQLYNDPEWGSYQEDTLLLDENSKAWAAYAGGLSETLVSEAVYGEKAGPVAQLTARLKTRHPKALDYLNLAWRADDGLVNPWDASPSAKDSTQLPAFLAAARQGYQQATDPFLKERYAFQAVKLACEQEDYTGARNLYDQLVKPLPHKTFVSDWALCRRAGASLALGDTARAIYEFAQVFDRCPSRRRAAETSLRKNRIKFREEALTFAQTDHERAAVYAICAIQPGQDALTLLKQMVKLDPKNPLIELVMAREINRNEYYFFMDGSQYMLSSYSAEPDSLGFVHRKDESGSYFEQLRSFALESAENKDLANGAFWYTAAAYLDYVVKDYKDAQTHLDQAALLATHNTDLKKQQAVQRMLLLAAQTEEISPAVETQLVGYLEAFDTTQRFRLNNAFVSVCLQFARLYHHKTETKGGFLASCSRSKTEPVDGPSLAKAYLLSMLTTKAGYDTYFSSVTEATTVEDTVSANTIQATLAYASQSNPTDFDKRLLHLAGLSTDYLPLLYGRRLLMEHRYAEAAEAFTKINPKAWATEPFTTYFQQNPFAVKMPALKAITRNQAIIEEAETNTYTPVTFARRMAELEQQAKSATGDQAAELYYQLGCGAWNLSWYGNAWLLVKSYWSAGEPPVYDVPTNPTEKQRRFDALLHTDYYTTTTAGTYFEQSAKAAKTPALADRSAYMAARCEANGFAVEKAIEQIRHGYVYEEDSTFVKNMRSLRQSKYARVYTDFYRNHTHSRFNEEMIRECAMYKDFLSFGEE